ncbi:hypothetical protein V8F20_008155 [Naviculisporaceae sp. PSN 640]
MPGPLFRVSVPVPGQPYRPPPSFKARAVSAAAHVIARRREADKPKATTIAIAAIVAGLILLLAIIIITRTVRSRHPNPKYIPTPFLKRLWTDWNVPAYKTGRHHAYEPTRNSAAEDDLSRRQTRATADAGSSLTYPSQTLERGTSTAPGAGAGVDRNTSVRSVMTLPVYRPRAAETEQVLGREGERDGIDVVVEMPTAEEEEALREEEMNALYQIRLTRRQQIAEREERRRLRREARENNDVLALQELRRQTRDSATRNNEAIEELRAEHERAREAARLRAVSSVSYADLGVARADGTRIRANSTESERVGLLSDAASIGRRPDPGSAATGEDSLQHRRDRSSGSIVSIDTARSNGDLPPESPALLTGGAGSSTFSLVTSNSSLQRIRSDSHSRSGLNTPRAGSSPEMIDSFEGTAGRGSGDLGDLNMPPPPDYETVSLGDITPARSGRNSPYDEPPPEYPGASGDGARIRNNRLSAQMEGLAISQLSAARSRGNSPMPSPAVPGTPMRLPEIRLPQIVIDPATCSASR